MEDKAEKDLTHQALQSRAAKQILDLEIERDQLKKRVADLEQQVRVLENPRVTDEDWHKLALMYKERVAELEAHVCFKIREQAEQAAACNQLDNENAHLRELHDNDMKRVTDAEADTKRYQELSDKYCLEVGRREAAAKIEGLRMAMKLLCVYCEKDLPIDEHSPKQEMHSYRGTWQQCNVLAIRAEIAKLEKENAAHT